MDAEAALTAVQTARTQLVLREPFFGVLALSAQVECTETVPTAATDGSRIFFNPSFVDTCSRDELLGVLAHEILHCAHGHPWRRNDREPVRWNVACDVAINQILLAAGFVLPAGVLCATSAQTGQSAEWIYARLPIALTRPKTLVPGSGAIDVCDAGQGIAPANKDSNGEMTPSLWDERLKQAALSAQAYGHLPAEYKRLVDRITAPRIDWRSALRRFIQATAANDYAWTWPNRRYVALGHYLPSLRSEQVGPIAVAVDTSGSIDAITLALFRAELDAIMTEAQPANITVIYADAAVHRVDVFGPGETIDLSPVGGGGTNFAPALDASEALNDPPCCLIYLTDLCGSHRPRPPAMPILWVSTMSLTAPYGEVLWLGE